MTDQPTTAPTQASQAEPEPLVLSQHVAASPDTVFDFLIEPEKMVRWFGVATDIEPRLGGRFWLDVNGTDVASGLYEEVVRPERVVFTFGWEDSPHVPAGSTTVTITLEPMPDDTTTVHLRHDGLPNGPADDHQRGWTYYLSRLADVAVGRDPSD